MDDNRMNCTLEVKEQEAQLSSQARAKQRSGVNEPVDQQAENWQKIGS